MSYFELMGTSPWRVRQSFAIYRGQSAVGAVAALELSSPLDRAKTNHQLNTVRRVYPVQEKRYLFALRAQHFEPMFL